jgi:hypothetical protein
MTVCRNKEEKIGLEREKERRKLVEDTFPVATVCMDPA